MEEELDLCRAQLDPTILYDSGLDHALTGNAADVNGVDVASLELSTSTTDAQCFAFKSGQNVEEAKLNSVPKNTCCNTKWAVKVWKDWSSNRQNAFPNSFGGWPIHLLLATVYQLDHWLSKFVVKASQEK